MVRLQHERAIKARESGGRSRIAHVRYAQRGLEARNHPHCGARAAAHEEQAPRCGARGTLALQQLQRRKQRAQWVQREEQRGGR